MGSSSLNEGGFRCECPRGMIGDGIGKEGCYRSNVTLCHSDTCYNQGTCQVISETEYLCHCEWGYAGKRCEYATACLNNICGGRGECIPKADASFECKCIRGYYGNKCQFEEDGSGVDSVVCSRADANVTLRDGDSSNSPLVGVYCGHHINKVVNFYVPPTSPIYFSSNKAFISFSSSQTRIGIGGFSFEWKTVEKSKFYIMGIFPYFFPIFLV
uniref:EGF-like domain-containing protein n=1 Tax=Parascaris equorum TaxID=6256 RepID=A0A914RDQ4_PAREQ